MAPPIDALTIGTWSVDPSHSSVGFTVRHMMVSKVRGRFSSFSGKIIVPDDKMAASVTAQVDAATVSTGDAGRDGHLRSGDFFDVERYPTWSLTGSGLRRDGDTYLLVADVTIKEATRPVEFRLELEGVAVDPEGNDRAGFSGRAEVNRKDFGLEWNVALEAGGVLVSDKVAIELDIQAVRAANVSGTDA